MIPDDVFVYDAVSHAYHLGENNLRDFEAARALNDSVYDTFQGAAPDKELRISEEDYLREWSMEETANMLFLESQTDMATVHNTNIPLYYDGQTGIDKAEAALRNYPQRCRTTVAVDPLQGDAALQEIERQYNYLSDIGPDPLVVKVYPSSWDNEGNHHSWTMDDEEVAYPIYEKAEEMGIPIVACHKAIPLGSAPSPSYHTEGVESAALNFPDLDFSIVHSGMNYVEETAWQLARYDNIYANLEVTSYLAYAAPRYFRRAFEGLFEVAGEHAADQIIWATGCSAFPAQPQLEAFWDFEFSDEIGGLFGGASGTITAREAKEQILGKNYVDLIGEDLDELKEGIEGDEFDQKLEEDGLQEPYSTSNTPNTLAAASDD